jgi:hypothetical protein
MQFRSWARGEGDLYSCKAARWRDARSGELNRKRQRTGQRFYLINKSIVILFTMSRDRLPFCRYSYLTLLNTST